MILTFFKFQFEPHMYHTKFLAARFLISSSSVYEMWFRMYFQASTYFLGRIRGSAPILFPRRNSCTTCVWCLWQKSASLVLKYINKFGWPKFHFKLWTHRAAASSVSSKVPLECIVTLPCHLRNWGGQFPSSTMYTMHPIWCSSWCCCCC